MAMAHRVRSKLPHLGSLFKSSQSLSQKNYATSAPANNKKVKPVQDLCCWYLIMGLLVVPIAMFGGSGNYASALYLAAAKQNSLEKVESELFDLVEATKKSPTFAQFTKDLSVPADTRIKAITDICDKAKFTDLTKNFMVILAEYGRLRHIDTVAKRFSELTMAHRGELKAVVTTVMPLPEEEEKELKETLQEILGQGKKVTLEQKIDPSILGGLVVEFGQKVFDMSIRTRARQMERFLREPINV